MNTFELEKRPKPPVEENAMFGMELDFDLNAAFQGAILGVASDAELALDEKVKRMEVIVNEGKSEIYRDFIDFRQMASQLQMMCSHDHALSQMITGNDSLASFLSHQDGEDGHSHQDHENDKKNKKKKNKSTKKRSWFGFYK